MGQSNNKPKMLNTYKDLLLYNFLQTVFSASYIGQFNDCDPGYKKWPENGNCYKLLTQGPCDEDQLFMQMSWGQDAEGVSFIEEDSTYSFENYKKLQSQTEWNLPIRGQRLSKLEEKCLSDGQVFWPADGRCYSLLTNGPCNEGEWLALTFAV